MPGFCSVAPSCELKWHDASTFVFDPASTIVAPTALAHDPLSTLSYALQLHAGGQLDAAAQIYESLLEASPRDARLLTQLGLARMQQQRDEDAAALLDRALAIDASACDARTWRGELFRRNGQLDAALAAFQQALALRQDFAPAWFNLGLAHADRGDADAASRAWVRFLELRPADARVRRELGRLAYGLGDDAEAERWFSEQLLRFPEQTDAICDLASLQLRQRAWEPARAGLAGVTAREPANARAQQLLGKALLGLGRLDAALESLVRAAELSPADAEAAYLVAGVFDRMARLDDAIAWFERAATLAPLRADIRNALAVAQLNFANHPQAIANFRAALALDSGFREAHSNLLLALHYVAPVDHQGIFDEHLQWAKLHAAAAPVPRIEFPNGRDPRRRLRIGYVSPRFFGGPLQHFFLPVLEAHDSQAIDVTCYAVSDEQDDVSALMRRAADRWRDCAQLDDGEMIDLMRADAIDILVDLVGHCPGNRLGVFARRAAPVQFTWMDYVDTTGLATIECIVGDEWHMPIGGAQRFTERVLRLPDARLCYRPLDALPPPATAPLLSRGHVTFGSFNRLSKFGPGVVESWAAILSATPGSRLLLKAAAFAAEPTREVVLRRFAAHGVAPERLDLRPFSSETQMLAEYGDVDIALDPFPFNGCTTTCDALSVGVPVLTLAGTTLAGRQGVALLGACGLTDWIAHSPREYVDLACAAARDGAGLARLRRELPARFLASPVCDAPKFARALEEGYRKAWAEWCGSSK